MAGSDKPFMRIVEEEPKTETEVATRSSVATDDGLVISPKLQSEIGGNFGIRPIKYEKKEKGKLGIAYAVDDGNYVYQVELAEPARHPENRVVAMIIQALKTVVPDHIDTYIGLPPKDLDWWVYTVIVKGIANQPGAKDFMEGKLVEELLKLNFWR